MQALLPLGDHAAFPANRVSMFGGRITRLPVVEEALSLTSNHGLRRANPLERYYRDVLCGRVHAPQDDATRINAGRLALGI
jgi:alkylation response protein AidB-like acyl-CoA dehydrogenase